MRNVDMRLQRMETDDGVVAALLERLRHYLEQLSAVITRHELRPLDAVLIAGVFVTFRSHLRPIYVITWRGLWRGY